MQTRREKRPFDDAITLSWIGLTAAASAGSSFILACAMPFAALAAIAATRLRVLDGMALVGLAWVLNQATGYLLLGYPRTPSSFAWGAMIGVAALAGLWAAKSVTGAIRGNQLLSAALSLIAAFAAYQLTLFVAATFLPSTPSAFAPGVVLQIFAVNGAAMLVLTGIHALTGRFGIAPRAPNLRMA
jgi:hypothetical protein